MDFRRLFLVLGLFCACDSLAPPPGGDASTGQTKPEPLPADLLAACPASGHFERAGRRACTDIGCQNGYALNVSPSGGWTAGAYRFELTLDDRAVTCQGSLPLKACGQQSFSCDADGVSLGESGCALPAGQQGIATITFQGYPLALTIRVLKDGAELTNKQLTPAYTAGQPNGPGCDPICCSASGELRVPAND